MALFSEGGVVEPFPRLRDRLEVAISSVPVRQPLVANSCRSTGYGERIPDSQPFWIGT
jgi:hypothetical protein